MMELRAQQQQQSENLVCSPQHSRILVTVLWSKQIINIIISAAPPTHKPLSQSLSVSWFAPKLCSLVLYANSSPCLVPSPAPRPLGCWIMHIMWRSWQAEPQLHTISIQTACCLWEECTSDLHTLANTPRSRYLFQKNKKYPHTFCQRSADVSLAFQ